MEIMSRMRRGPPGGYPRYAEYCPTIDAGEAGMMYRRVKMTETMTMLAGANVDRFVPESEWRSWGIQQSLGWIFCFRHSCCPWEIVFSKHVDADPITGLTPFQTTATDATTNAATESIRATRGAECVNDEDEDESEDEDEGIPERPRSASIGDSGAAEVPHDPCNICASRKRTVADLYCYEEDAEGASDILALFA